MSLGIKRNGTFLWYGREVDFKNFDNILKEGSDSLSFEFVIKNFETPRRGIFYSKNKVELFVGLTLLHRENNNELESLKHLQLKYEDQVIDISYNAEDNSAQILINGDSIAQDLDKVMTSDTISLLPRLLFIHGDEVEEDYPYWCRRLFSNVSSRPSYRIFHRITRVLYFGNKTKTLDYVLSQIKDEDEYQQINKQILNNAYLLLHLNNIIDAINLRLLSLASNITYIAPFRAAAQRYYRIQNSAVDDIDSNGENLAMYLYNLNSNDLAHFQDWTVNLFNFKVAVHSVSGNLEMLIQEGDKPQYNLIDVGFGYTQILPVLCVIWKALYKDINFVMPEIPQNYNEHIIAIEQPELHLHPRLQGLFAAMLVKVVRKAKAQNRDIRFIIETHSETIINKLGELVATEQCGQEDVNIYIFNALHEGMNCYIEKSVFNSEGHCCPIKVG